jgi:hypothetical protein
VPPWSAHGQRHEQPFRTSRRTTVTVTLYGKNGEAEIDVPDFLDWEDSAVGYMSNGLIREWAEGALDDENYAKWCEVRPTNRTAAQFVDAWSEATGEDPGESPAS